MKNNERYSARRYDLPLRSRKYTDIVYSGDSAPRQEMFNALKDEVKKYFPEKPEYNVYFGELHGHSNLSDGAVDIDEYFLNVRDNAKLDFCALSDHDHGGVGKKELWHGNWDVIKEKVKEYYEAGKFTTILAYERDSYPWYNNLVVYYNNHDGDLLLGAQNGEISREELHNFLNRDDVILVPHDTNIFSAGADFIKMELQDMTPLIQVFSRANYCEMPSNEFLSNSDCEGGHWQDALKKGAKMGCIAASDDHRGKNGLFLENMPYPQCFPGITAVLAKENTLEGIFEALKARRCYGVMYGKIYIDFRINGHYMGEEITVDGDRNIYFKIDADGEIDTVTLVKKCRDYIVFKENQALEQVIFDYEKESPEDYYYLRVRLKDGRLAWTSPIWVK